MGVEYDFGKRPLQMAVKKTNDSMYDGGQEEQ